MCEKGMLIRRVIIVACILTWVPPPPQGYGRICYKKVLSGIIGIS